MAVGSVRDVGSKSQVEGHETHEDCDEGGCDPDVQKDEDWQVQQFSENNNLELKKSLGLFFCAFFAS